MERTPPHISQGLHIPVSGGKLRGLGFEKSFSKTRVSDPLPLTVLPFRYLCLYLYLFLYLYQYLASSEHLHVLILLQAITFQPKLRQNKSAMYFTEIHLTLNSTFYVCFLFLSKYDVKSRLQIIMGTIAYWAVDPTPIIDYLAL